MLAGAAVVAAVVWLSVAAEVWQLVDGAGWWALAALAFPVTVAVLAHRFGEPYRG
jgi:hypothetical protein